MPDLSGLTNEEFDDLAAGLGPAIKRLEGMLKDAENELLGTKAKTYEEYLQKIYKVDAVSSVLGDLQSIRKSKREALK